MFSSQTFTVTSKLYSQLACYKSTTVPMKRTAFQQLHCHEKPNITTVRGHSFTFKWCHDVFCVTGDIQVRFLSLV